MSLKPEELPRLPTRISEETTQLKLGPSQVKAAKDEQLPPVQQGPVAGFLGQVGQAGPVRELPDVGSLKLQARDHVRSPVQQGDRESSVKKQK